MLRLRFLGPVVQRPSIRPCQGRDRRFESGRDRQSLPLIPPTVTATSGMTAGFGRTATMRPPPTRIVPKSSAMSCLRRSGRARSHVAERSCASRIAVMMRRSSGAVSRRSNWPLRSPNSRACPGARGAGGPARRDGSHRGGPWAAGRRLGVRQQPRLARTVSPRRPRSRPRQGGRLNLGDEGIACGLRRSSHHFGESLGGRLPVERTSWTAVELARDSIELALRSCGEVLALGEVLTEQTVGVLSVRMRRVSARRTSGAVRPWARRSSSV